MKITKLFIENFLVIGEAKIDLDHRGLVLVQGVNNDDSSANSNGAGKSSIVDAISWCLYGVTARGKSGDSVINNKVGKNCAVEVVIEDGGKVYSILRFRKHATGKNSLRVLAHKSKVDLTLGTDKLTQEVVDKIIGCSYDVFVAAIYAGQEKMPDLPGMTDKNLKLIVEEAAGIERLQAAHELALIKSKGFESLLNLTNLNVARANEDLKRANEDLERFTERSSFYERGIEENIDKLEGELSKKKGFLALAQGKYSKSTELTTALALKETLTLIDKTQADEKARLNELYAKQLGLEKGVAAVETMVKLAANSARAAKSELDTIDSRIGAPCSECGKTYCEEDMHDAKKNAEAKLKLELIKLKSAKETLTESQKALTIAQNERKAFEATLTDISELLKRCDDLQQKLKEQQQALSEIRSIEATIDSLQTHIDKDKGRLKINPFSEMVEKKKEEIERIEAEIKSLVTKKEEAEQHFEYSKQVVEVFGRAGIRAHILDTVTPFLNDRTAEYLSTLTDGNITASWSTLSKTAKGELRESFSIAVEKRNGSKDFGGLSGGEKRKVRLASAMALQDLVASRATKPIEFQLYDEIDDALDSSGLERLMTILEKRGREKGTVLVISHNDLNGMIENVITVTNNGGISTVVDE